MNIPPGWTRGELLNVMNEGYRFKIARISEPEPYVDSILFTDAHEAQQFVSWWYVPKSAQVGEHGSP